MNKVVIVGAGPCGILLAHYLLRRHVKYQIEIYEGRNDPRKDPLLNFKSIPYGLSERGLKALRKIEGLEEAVKSICLENRESALHKENGKTLLQSRKKPTYATNRDSLITTLLSKLTENDNNQLKINFNCKCTSVDFQAKTVKFEKDEKEELIVNYDMLIGADGARSIVRRHFLNTEFFEFEQKYVLNCYKTIFIPPNDLLKSNCLHFWRPEDTIAFGAVPQLDKSFIGILFFPKDYKKVMSLSSKEEVIAYFSENIPEIATLISESDAEAFFQKPPSSQLKIRCNRYHYQNHTLIIGDAAHAVSSSLGQGCNAAFEDVLLFDSLLDEYSDNWTDALVHFTIRRKPDAYALSELDTNVFPLSKTLSREFFLRESLSTVMNKLFPQFFLPPLRHLISQTTVPYSEVLNSHKGWVSKVKKSNQQLATDPEPSLGNL